LTPELFKLLLHRDISAEEKNAETVARPITQYLQYWSFSHAVLFSFFSRVLKMFCGQKDFFDYALCSECSSV